MQFVQNELEPVSLKACVLPATALMCALAGFATFTRKMIVAEEAIYDPRSPNDRLLLSMKPP
ncbi:hypothetical protein ACVWYQ_003308 [Bradyrhizobium sp. USDA 3397]